MFQPVVWSFIFKIIIYNDLSLFCGGDSVPHVKVKSRTLAIVLYPDSQQHIIDEIKKSYSFICCLHDRDVDADGNLKKAHVHFILRFKQARWSSAVASELGIDDHFESVKNLDGAVRYLVHEDSPDKFHYSVDDDLIYSADNGVIVKKCMSLTTSEDERALQILDFIDSFDGRVSLSCVYRYAMSVGFYADLRRMGVLALRLIDEHNALFAV